MIINALVGLDNPNADTTLADRGRRTGAGGSNEGDGG